MATSVSAPYSFYIYGSGSSIKSEDGLESSSISIDFFFALFEIKKNNTVFLTTTAEFLKLVDLKSLYLSWIQKKPIEIFIHIYLTKCSLPHLLMIFKFLDPDPEGH